MAGRQFNQTDTTGSVPVQNVCDVIGNPVSGSSVSIDIRELGTLGVNTEGVGPGNNQTHKVIAFVTPALTFTDWNNNANGGDWIVRINCTTAKANVTWTRCYICRREGSTTYVEIASQFSINISMGTTGVKTVTFAQDADETGDGTDDRVYIICTFNSTNTMGNSKFTLTRDQVIDSPFQDPNNRVVLPVATITLTPNAPTVVATERRDVDLPSADLTVAPKVPTVVSTDKNVAFLAAALDFFFPTYDPIVVATEKHIIVLPSQAVAVVPNVPNVESTENKVSLLPSQVITLTPNVPTAVSTDKNIIVLPSQAITVSPFVPLVSTSTDNIVQLQSVAITLTPNVPIIESFDSDISQIPSQTITVTPFVPIIEVFDPQTSQLPSQAITVTLFVPVIEVFDPQISQLPVQAITVTPFIPSAVTSEKHISELPSQVITLVPKTPIIEAFQSEFSQIPSQDITVTPFVITAIADESHEKIVANSKIGDSGHSSCSLSDLQNDDSNWCLAASISSNTESHVGFPTPTVTPLLVGVGLQKLIGNVRAHAGNEASNPQAHLELWESGSFVRAGSNINISQGQGNTQITFSFNSTELADATGAGVEGKMITDADQEPGFSGSIDTGRICFISQSGSASLVLLPVHNITLVPKIPQIESIDVVPNISQVPSQVITVTPFVPSIVSTDKNVSALISLAVTLSPFAPLISTSTDNIIQLGATSITVTPFVPQILSGDGNVSQLPVVGFTLLTKVPQVVTFDPNAVTLPSQVITVTPFVPKGVASENKEKINTNNKIGDSGHSSCVLADLQAQDGNWCVAATISSNTETHVSFPSPANTNLNTAAATQKIIAHFRANAGNEPSTPVARIELWEAGSLVRAGSDQTVTGDPFIVTLNFNANELSDQTGADIEMKTITTADQEPGFSGSIDTGFTCLVTDSLVGELVQLPSQTITVTPFAPTIEFFEDQISQLPSQAITLVPKVPIVEAFNPSVSQLPSQVITLTPKIPTVRVAQPQISQIPSRTITLTPFGIVAIADESREKIITNNKISDSGHSSCTLADLQNDDSNWCIAASITSSTESHVSFPSPANSRLKVTVSSQRIIANVRDNAGNEPSLPTARIELWEAGSLVRAGSNVNISTGSGNTQLTFAFNANELSDQTGADVEAKVITVADGEPSNSGSIDTGRICFVSDSDIGPISQLPVRAITLVPKIPQIVSASNQLSLLPSQAITLTPNAITVEAFQSQISQLPAHTVTVTPNVPAVVSTEFNTSTLPSQAIILVPKVPQIATSEGADNTSELPSRAITLTPFVPTIETFDPQVSQLPSQDITVTPFVPTVVTVDSQISQLPSQAITLTPFVPLVVATEDDAVPTTFRVGFPTPTTKPKIGTDTQIFKWFVRRDIAGVGGTGVPTADLFLYENGIQRQVLQSGISVTSDAGQLIEGTWDPANLATEDGSLVEARLVTTVGGAGANARTIELGAVEWCVVHETADEVLLPSASIVLVPQAPTVDVTENRNSQLPSVTITLTPFAPQVVITEHLGGTDDLTFESLSAQYTFAILPQVAVDTRFIRLSVKHRTVLLTSERTTVSLSNISTIKEV